MIESCGIERTPPGAYRRRCALALRAPPATRRHVRRLAGRCEAHDTSSLGKARTQQRLELRRQIDLRHQQQHLAQSAPLASRVLDGAQVHLGLAAASDAEQQVRRESLTRRSAPRSPRCCCAVEAGRGRTRPTGLRTLAQSRTAIARSAAPGTLRRLGGSDGSATSPHGCW